MEKIVTNLMVTDMRHSLDFYCGQLGFTLTMGVNHSHEVFIDGNLRDDLIFVTLTQGQVELMLQHRDSFTEDVPAFSPDTNPSGTFTLYIRGVDVDGLAERLPVSVKRIKGPATTWYGMREFYICDPDGYILALGAPDGAPPL